MASKREIALVAIIIILLITNIYAFSQSAKVATLEKELAELKAKPIVTSPTWDDIVAKAKEEGTVIFYGYGDEFMKKFFLDRSAEFEAKYGIKVEYHHGDWFSTVEKLKADKAAGKTVGDVDLVFLWSKPFADAWEAGTVWQYDVMSILPNAKTVPYELWYQTDFFPTYGAMVPGVWWQVGFVYRTDKVTNPPKSLDELLDWCKANPGRFTYCDPNKGGSGHTFLMTLIYWMYGYDTYAWKDLGKVNPAKENWTSLWNYLNELEKYMYHPGEYPAGNMAAMELLAAGEVWLEPQWMDIVWDQVKAGRLDPSVIKVYIPEPTICAGGFDGFMIPWYAPHKEAAMLYMNFWLSEETQMKLITDWAVYPLNTEVWKKAPADIKAQVWWPEGGLDAMLQRPLWFRHALYMYDAMSKWTDEVARK